MHHRHMNKHQQGDDHMVLSSTLSGVEGEALDKNNTTGLRQFTVERFPSKNETLGLMSSTTKGNKMKNKTHIKQTPILGIPQTTPFSL